MLRAHYLLAIAAFSLLAGSLAACGGDDGNGTTGTSSTDLTIEEAAQKEQDIRCMNGVACHLYADDAECRATTRATPGQYKASVAAGRIKYHPEKVQACLDALDAAIGCSIIDVFGAPAKMAEDACKAAYEPTVADGGACYVGTECISQNCDIPSCGMTCCEGKCAASAGAKIGDSCAAGETCEDGAYCKADSMGMPTTCAAVAAEGKACDAIDGCAAPAFCALDFVTNIGTCVVPAAHGADCNTSAIFPCDELDDYCDATTKKCVSTKLVGEACDMQSPCAPNATCNSGKCEEKPVVGGKCDPNDPLPCIGDLQCQMTDSTCQLPPESICP